MRPRHVMVIDPAMQTPELDSFNRMAATATLPLTYHLPALHGMGSIRRDDENVAGVVVLGSASSVHDRLPWQAEFGAWLREKMAAAIPTLGLCFGHQLIAELYGAEVDFLYPDHHKRAGFEPTALAPNPLLGEEPRTIDLYASHREVVTSCPPNFEVIATRDGVPNDGFAHRDLPIWTFQTHPEATPEFLENRGMPVEDRARFAPGNAIVDRFIRSVDAE